MFKLIKKFITKKSNANLSEVEETHNEFMQAAIDQAKRGLAEGGIPIGSVLVLDGKIIGRGHNQRVQKDSAILHAEMDCINNIGRLTPAQYQRSVLYSTLSPCSMCSGTIVLYKIPKVVIGENETFLGAEDFMRDNGVKVINMDNQECKNLMREFIQKNPELWFEDIGEVFDDAKQEEPVLIGIES